MASARGKKRIATEEPGSGLSKKTKGLEKDVNVLERVLSLCGDKDTLSAGKFKTTRCTLCCYHAVLCVVTDTCTVHFRFDIVFEGGDTPWKREAVTILSGIAP